VSSLAVLAGTEGALASRPAVADGAAFVLPSGATAAADAAPGALRSHEASWSGLAVDAYFMHLARTSQPTPSVTSRDTAPRHTFSPVTPVAPGEAAQLAPPPARVTGTPSPALAREASNRPADDWATDVLTSADPWWDGLDASWSAR